MTVKEVLQLDTLDGARVIAGKKGLAREVREMAVMEVPDVDDYLNRHDFLLTTLYPVCDSEKEQRELVLRLNALGVSGIGVKLNRYVKAISQETMDAAEKIDFPIIILPKDSNFSHQISDFLKRELCDELSGVLNRKTRQGKHDKQGKNVSAEKSGAARIIESCENTEELMGFSNALLAEVVQYDKKNHTELLPTLRKLIEHGGSIKETASAMFVHYNTVRYRVKLLSQLTGKNLQNFGDLSDLNFALKICSAFSNRGGL